MRNAFLCCLLLLLTGFVQSQSYHPFIRNFGPREYGKEQPPENYAVLQDKNGLLYFGNAGGILQYDGSGWNFIPVKTGNFVTTLSIDSAGTIFVGSFGEFGYLKTGDNGSLYFESLLPLLPENERSVGAVIRCFCTGTVTYFQLEDRIIRYENKQCSAIGTESTFHLSFLVNDHFYARERYTGLVEIKDGKKTLISDDTLFSEYGIFALLPYDEHTLMVTTMEKGLFLFNLQDKRLRNFGTDSLLLRNTRFYGGLFLEGHYVLNTLDNGIFFLNRQGEILHYVNKNAGLSSNEIKQIIADRQKNIWAVTPAGISFINTNNPFEYFDVFDGLEGSVENVCNFENGFYAATSEGLFVMQQGTNYFNRVEAIGGHVFSLKKLNQSLFVCSDDGFYRISNAYVQKIQNGSFNLIQELKNNQALLVSSTGMELFNYRDLVFVPKKEELSITRALSSVYLSDKNECWIGTLGMGVIRVQFNENCSKIINWMIYDDMDGLDISFTRPAMVDGELTFLTANGFDFFIDENEVAASLPDSLKNNPDFARGYFDIKSFRDQTFKSPVSAFTQDSIGHALVCVNNRVHAFTDEYEYTTLFNSIDLGRINGLYYDETGYFYICGDDGLIRFNLHKSIAELEAQNRQSFPAVIKSITGKNGQIYFGGEFINGKAPLIQLPYKENTLAFEVAYPFFIAGHQPEYSWILEGHEEEWSKWSSDNKARFTNLHEGHYLFRVKSRNIFGEESQETSYAFDISAPWYRTTWAYILYAIILILLIYLSIRIASYNLKQKNIWLENVVQERTREIARKNEELELSNIQILHQKNEITDSITYAKRIQEAILPLKKEISNYLPKSFVLFKPKDIVSGDFYWFYPRENYYLIACADCTGHGVPGAFMSMICTDKLNHAVHEQHIINPGGLLSEVNRGIKKSLKQEAQGEIQTKDGMDAALCGYDAVNNVLVYSGANRPLWLVRKGEITEYKPTKTAVGGFTPEDQVFEENIIEIQSGDRIYMSSDGYADQFGGDRGKKMMVKNFKEKILTIQDQPMQKQAELLDQYFESWKNHTDENGLMFEQVDDVCVIGVEF